MNILIIIVTWNKKNYVLDLLDSVATLASSDFSVDILVVDNASEDGTVGVIKEQYPQVKLVCNAENIGGTGGFNTGLKWAFENEKYEYLWLLDNDVVVHQNALIELVSVLEKNNDIAIAGSTMMQLDFPHKINEMGAFINRADGQIILNRHLEIVPAWQGSSAKELLNKDVDLSKQLDSCLPCMDVDYVAAASLLIRADVAKEAGLWRDYFIHFDDIEWCLRIADMGHRVVVSSKSLIWHLSAVAKISTWILYYDNRNVLDLLENHGATQADLTHAQRHIMKKAAYYYLIGKADLAQLLYDAVEDFNAKRFGKKDIKLDYSYQNNKGLKQFLEDPSIKRVLIAYPVDVYAMGIQEALVKIQKQRPEMEIDWVPSIYKSALYPIPRTRFIKPLSKFIIIRLIQFWRLRGQYDLVIQSDYKAIIGLSWLNSRIVFINNSDYCERPGSNFKSVLLAVKRFLFF